MSQIGTLTASPSSSIVLSYLPQYLTIEGNLPTTLGSNPQSQLNVTSLNVSVDGVEVCNIQGKDEINTSFFAGKQISLVTSPDAKWYASTYYMELSNGKIDGRNVTINITNGSASATNVYASSRNLGDTPYYWSQQTVLPTSSTVISDFEKVLLPAINDNVQTGEFVVNFADGYSDKFVYDNNSDANYVNELLYFTGTELSNTATGDDDEMGTIYVDNSTGEIQSVQYFNNSTTTNQGVIIKR